MNRSINSTNSVSLDSISKDPTYIELAKNKYIPTIISTGDERFISSTEKTYSDIGGEFVKFLIINKSTKEITNDSKYLSTRLPKDCYLVRLSLSRRNSNPEFLTLDYIVDINDIHINEYIDNGERKIIGFVTIEDISEILTEDMKTLFNMSDESRKRIIKEYFDDQFDLTVRKWREYHD